jgi:serine/threonine protein kinase
MLGLTIDGRYQIRNALGTGGWSSVYLADDMSLQRKVALKVLHASLAGDQNRADRFKQEAVTISSLVHPNIITVFDYGCTPEGQPYLVMEYVNGETLDKLIEREGSLSLSRSIDIMSQCCSALSAAHKAGIIHRDIKPQNILLSQTDEGDSVKILDFGLARLVCGDNKLTKTGQAMGTPGYMSPEQYFGQQTDQTSDIYSLGCVLFECLTGKPCFNFTADSLQMMATQTLQGIPKLKTARPDLYFPPIIQLILDRATDKEPANRFANAGLLKAELEGSLAGNKKSVDAIKSDVKSAANAGLPQSILLAGVLAITIAGISFALLQYMDHKKSQDGILGEKNSNSGGNGAITQHANSAEKPAARTGAIAHKTSAPSKIVSTRSDEDARESAEKNNTDSQLKSNAASRVITLADTKATKPGSQTTNSKEAERSRTGVNSTQLESASSKTIDGKLKNAKPSMTSPQTASNNEALKDKRSSETGENRQRQPAHETGAEESERSAASNWLQQR